MRLAPRPPVLPPEALEPIRLKPKAPVLPPQALVPIRLKPKAPVPAPPVDRWGPGPSLRDIERIAKAKAEAKKRTLANAQQTKFPGALEDKERRLTWIRLNQAKILRFNLWPQWAQEAILKKYIGNAARYGLMQFMTYNGIPPGIAQVFIQSYVKRSYKVGDVKDYDIGFRVGETGGADLDGLADWAAAENAGRKAPGRKGPWFKPGHKYFNLDEQAVIEY